MSTFLEEPPRRVCYSHSCIERVRTLALLLRQGRAFTAGEVAERFETSRRTIVRDLEFMRDRLGYEYEFDASRNRYFLRHAPPPII